MSKMYQCLVSHVFQPRTLGKNNLVLSLRQLTALLLVFLFIVSPLQPVFASSDEANENAASESLSNEKGSISSSELASTSIIEKPTDSANSTSEVQNPSTENIVTPEPTRNETGDEPATEEDSQPLEEVPQNDTSSSAMSTPGDGTLPYLDLPDNAASLPLANNQTGALSYSYPIKVPPGRNGLQPNLSLQYDSQNRSGGDIFGFGWNVNIPSITRVNKLGSNNLYSTSTATGGFFESSLSGELVFATSTASTSTYVSRVDNGDFLQYQFSNNQWTVTDKQGNQYQFGYTDSARQDNASSTSQVYKWMLEKMVDTNNNFIAYTYYKDLGQIYPSVVTYTGNGGTDGIFTVTFSRESRLDISTSSATSFPVTTRYRISRIETAVSGTWVGRYELTYTTGDNGVRTILASITQSGRDSLGTVTTLPSTSFTNQQITNLSPDGVSMGMPSGINSNFVDFGDINGDGLTDLFASYYLHSNNTTVQKTFLNTGNNGWIEASQYAPPEVFYNTDIIGYHSRTHYLIDVNGDGRDDLIALQIPSGCGVPCTTAYYKTYLNSGYTWATSTWEVTGFVAASIDGSTRNPNFIDVNGDHLPDIAIADRVYLNNGTNWNASSTIWNFPVDPVYSDTSTKFADINGDGILDILVANQNDHLVGPSNTLQRDSTMQAWLGDGKGSFSTSTEYISPVIFQFMHGDWGCDGGYCIADTGVRILDYNGDGLNDLVQSTSGTTITTSSPTTTSSVQRVYLNTGKGWSSPVTITMSSYFTTNGWSSRWENQFGDFNGDGITDVFYQTSYDKIKSYPAHADTVKVITYPAGGNSTIQYKSSPQYLDGSSNILNPHLPQPISTVYQVATSDGLNTGNSTSTQTYVYSGGEYFFNNALDRKFGGFNKITATDSAGNVTKIYYHTGNGSDSSHGLYQDNVFKIGKSYRTEVYDSGANLYKKIINKWDSATSTATTTAGFVKLVQTVESDYDGLSTHKDKAITSTYNDVNGNLNQKNEWGEVTGSDDGSFTDTGSDKFTTAITYASSSTSTVISLPAQITVTDQSFTKVKESKYYYDNLTHGSVSKGNQTKEEQWKSSSSYINAQKTYNSLGLVTQTTDPGNATTTYTYDSYNLYPTTVTEPLSLATQYTYNYTNGKVLQKTDPNGNKFESTYDGLGRLTEQKQPNISSTSTLESSIKYTYSDTLGGVNVRKSTYLDSSNIIDNYTYFDGLSRMIQERQESASSTDFSVKDLAYNQQGELDKESLPYFSASSSKTSLTNIGNLYTSYTYDPLGRILSETNAVGATTHTYSNWKHTTVDQRGFSKDFHYDAFGNLNKVTEYVNSVATSTPLEFINSSLYSDSYLTAYYRLENTNDSKGAYHLSNNGSVSFSNSKFNNGADLGSSGNSKSLRTSNTLGIDGGSASFICWVKKNANISSGKYAFAAYQANGNSKTEYRLGIDNASGTEKIDFTRGKVGIADNDAKVTYTWNVGDWHQIAGTYDGTTVTLYLDGFAMTSTGSSGNGNTAAYTSGFSIGNNNDNSSFIQTAFTVDDCAIFSRALNSSEVANLYNGTISYVGTPYNTLYTYDYNNNLTSITDAVGNVRNFTYDGLGHRLSAQDLHSSGDTTYGSYTYTYDDSGNLTQKIDPKNQTVNYTYDSLNRILTEDYTGQAGTEVSFIYDTCTQGKGRMCNSSSSSISISNFYNALGQISQDQRVIGGSTFLTAYTYDRQGNKLVITNPDSSQIRYTYNSAGFVNSVERKESGDVGFSDVITNITYNPVGQAMVITYANNTETTNTYDANKLYRLTHKVTNAPTGNSFSFSRSNTSFTPEAIEIPEATPVEQIASSTISDIQDISTTSSSTSLELENTTSPISLLSKTILGMRYILSGLMSIFISVSRAITLWLTPHSAYAVAPELYTTSFFGDANLVSYYRLENTSDSKGTNTLTNNGSVSFSSAKFNNGADTGSSSASKALRTSNTLGIDGGNVSFTCWVKKNANVASGKYAFAMYQENNSSKTEYRLGIDNGSGTEKIDFTRGKVGTVDNDAKVTYTWNIGDWHHMAGTYDGTTVSLYFDGVLQAYTTSSGNGSVAAYTSGFSIGNNNDNSSFIQNAFTVDDCAVFSRALDSTEIADIYDITATSYNIQDLTYTYDSNGNIANVVDDSETNTSKTIGYSYDDLNRLTTASSTLSAFGSNYTYNYSYDILGNILSRNENGSTTSYTYATNTPAYLNPHAVATTTAASSLAYTYDNNGNLLTVRQGTSTPTSSYTWDYNNRLTQTVGNSATSTYSYDPSGQRVKQTIATGTTASTYYPTKFYNTNGTTPTKHIFVGGMLVATVTGTGTTSAVSYIHTDHLGGMNVATDDSGAVVSLEDIYPYGNTRIDEVDGFNEQRKGISGHEYDPTSGLTYANARYYSALNAKFISQDQMFVKVGFDLHDPQSMNAYTYARNNPLVNIDPDGKMSLNVIGFLPNSVQVSIGNWANNAHENNSVARFALDHPYTPAIVGAAPLALYGAIVAAPAIAAGASDLAASPLAAPILRSGAFGAAGGVLAQATDDAVKGKVSGVSTYVSSAGKGAFVAVGGELGGPLVAGAAGFTTSVASDVSNNQSVDYTKALITGALSYGGDKLSDSASKIPGRLPSVGSYSYYFGKHAEQEALQQGVGVGVDSLKSIFGGIINSTKK